jgi:hypothetical protein
LRDALKEGIDGAFFKVVGNEFPSLYERNKGAPMFELKGRPWIMLTQTQEVRPFPEEDRPTLRMDDPGFPGNVPSFGSAGLDIIVPAGSYAGKINTQAGWTSAETTTRQDIQAKLLSTRRSTFGGSAGYTVEGDLGKGWGTYMVDPK